MRVAIVGATGLVGRKMAQILQERGFPVTELIPVASKTSAGQIIEWKGNKYTVVTPEKAVEMKPNIALFSAGSDVSGEWAPKFAAIGCRVIDNSSRWRTTPSVKLIVPEVNGDIIEESDMIIANPNCSTIQMVVALNLLHKEFKLKRIVVSTYQSVTGSGQKGVEQFNQEREATVQGKTYCEWPQKAYDWPIDLNVIPQIDAFLENGYTKEEMKMVNETHKIFIDTSIAVTATTVRVPVTAGHSESICAEFHKNFTIEEIISILHKTPGTTIITNEQNPPYPMPLYALDSDQVFVGRIREDLFCSNTINMWVVADNLRKGAATNAIQIAEHFLKNF